MTNVAVPSPLGSASASHSTPSSATESTGKVSAFCTRGSSGSTMGMSARSVVVTASPKGICSSPTRWKRSVNPVGSSVLPCWNCEICRLVTLAP